MTVQRWARLFYDFRQAVVRNMIPGRNITGGCNGAVGTSVFGRYDIVSDSDLKMTARASGSSGKSPKLYRRGF